MGFSRLACLGLAACGAVSAPAVPDAKDAAVDAPSAGPVTVTTQTRFYDGGQPPFTPQGNIIVVAVRPDGTLADMQTTDATAGTATLNAYPGDSVTAIYPHISDAGADLTTFYGVKPGDTLTFGLRFSQPVTSQTLGSMTVTMPALPSTEYFAYTSCANAAFGTTASGTITESNYCHSEPMDILVVARDATSHVLTQAGLVPSINFQSGGTASLAQWRPATTTKTLGLTGLSPDVVSVSTEIYEMANDTVIFGNGFGGPPSNGQYTTSPFEWPGQGTREVNRITLNRQGPWTQMAIHDNHDATTAPYSLAVPMLPPWLTSSYIVSGPAQMAAWFPVGDGPQKGALANVYWSHNSASYSWSFIVPPGQTAINFPKLPAAAAMYAPYPEDFVYMSYVRLFDIPELATYDDVRKLPESTIADLGSAVQLGLLERVIQNY